MTTGYNFEGYRIVSYLDIVSGGTVLGTGFLTEITASFSDLLGTSSGMFSDKLEKAREIAKKELVSSAAKAGGNAVIGVDFDYISFPGNMIGVVASGTAVVIE